MENNHEQTPEKIDLLRLLHGLWKQTRRLWWLVVALGVLGGVMMYGRAVRTYRPRYQTQAVFSVSVSYGGGTDIIDYVDYYDYAAAKLATETFPYILRSEAMTQRLKQLLGTEYLNGTVTATSLGGNTNFFRMTVESSSPADAYNILQAVIEVFPQISRQVIGNTQLTVKREPTLPTQPCNSFAWHSATAKGVAIGVLAGLAVLLVLSILRGTVYSREDLKKHIPVACLAAVPEVAVKKRSKSTASTLLITGMEEDAPFREAFRLLRLKLLRHLEAEKEKVIVVTSSLPSEGKSCMAANTALSLAALGKRVLLIDGDLRIQNQKKTLQLDTPSEGLAELLADPQREPEPIAVGETGLYLLAGDTTLRNPASLLRHDRLAQLLRQLRQQYDYIVIDTPPCLMMADAAIICRYADAVAYVVRQDYATRAQITDGIQIMTGAGGKLAGVVFNRSSAGSSGSYGSYGYSRRYGYAGEQE